MKRKVSIVSAWIISRHLAEETINNLDVLKFSDLFERFSNGELARYMRKPLGIENSNTPWKKGFSMNLHNVNNIYRLDKDQLEQIFVQSISIVWNHFGYKTELTRLRSSSCPFVYEAGFGKNYFDDSVFEVEERFIYHPEVRHLKKFPKRNYYKSLIQKTISLNQAIYMCIEAATEVAWELYQLSFLEDENNLSKDFAEEGDFYIKDFIADEITWYLYKYFSRDYSWTSDNFNSLISQAVFILSNHAEELVEIRGAKLDQQRAYFEGLKKGYKYNYTPSLESLESPSPYQHFQFNLLEGFS